MDFVADCIEFNIAGWEQVKQGKHPDEIVQETKPHFTHRALEFSAGLSLSRSKQRLQGGRTTIY